MASGYQRTIVGHAIGLLSGSLFFASVPWLALKDGVSASMVAWMTATPTIGYILSGLIVQRLLGAWSLRCTSTLGSITLIAGALLLVFSGDDGSVPVWAAYLSLMLMGASSQLLAVPAATRIVLFTDDPDLLRQRQSLYNTIRQLSAFGAGAFGVALTGIISISTILAIAIGATGVALAINLTIAPEREHALERHDGVINALRSHRGAARIIVIQVIWNVAVMGFAAIKLVWLADVVGAGEGDVLIFGFCEAAGTILFGIWISRTEVATRTIVVTGLVLQGGIVLIFITTLPVTFVWPLAAAFVFANTAISSMFFALSTQRTPRRAVSTVINAGAVSSRIAGLISTIVVSALLSVISYQMLFLAGAIGLLATAAMISRETASEPTST